MYPSDNFFKPTWHQGNIHGNGITNALVTELQNGNGITVMPEFGNCLL